MHRLSIFRWSNSVVSFYLCSAVAKRCRCREAYCRREAQCRREAWCRRHFSILITPFHCPVTLAMQRPKGISPRQTASPPAPPVLLAYLALPACRRQPAIPTARLPALSPSANVLTVAKRRRHREASPQPPSRSVAAVAKRRRHGKTSLQAPSRSVVGMAKRFSIAFYNFNCLHQFTMQRPKGV